VKTFPPVAGAEGTVFPIFYRNGMAAVLEALDEVHGDLSGGEKRFQRALSRVRLDAPNGHISLDGNRQAIGTNYLGRIMRDIKGKTRATTFRAVPGVDQTFGGYFRPGDPLPSRTVPSCVRRTPPRWAR
jgi:branched-chain amino acid transport system substrate-binding protein